MRHQRVPSENMTAIVQKVDKLLEIDPADKRHIFHIFYEEMKRLFYAMCKLNQKTLMRRHSNDSWLPLTDCQTLFIPLN